MVITKAFGIPTIWLNFLSFVEANKAKLDLSRLKLEQVVSGGSAPPRATIEKFRDLMGVFLLQAWGMTETSPLATVGSPLAKHEGLSASDLVDVQVKQGRQVFGIDLKLAGPRSWRNGRFPTTSSSSTGCRIPRPASCSRRSCVSDSTAISR